MLERMREIGKKLLFPGWRWVIPLAALSTAALVQVFTRTLQDTPLAYGVYALSTYALVISTAQTVRTGWVIWRRLNTVSVVGQYRGDAWFRARMGLGLSLLANLCYAGLKVGAAIAYTSFWEGALGIYYLLLCALRMYLFCRTPAAQADVAYPQELRIRRTAGIFLLGLSGVLVWISFQIVQDGQGYRYPGFLIYAAAAYSFYCLTLAIKNVIQYRKIKSPVLSASKTVSLTTALVSIFSLETAMLAQFGSGPLFRLRMTAATAAVVCILVFLMALSMAADPRRTRRTR